LEFSQRCTTKNGILRSLPKRDDSSHTLARPWADYTETTITNPHFGVEPVRVFAIKVN